MEKDNRSIRYRVYPTEKQQDILQQTFGCARLVFNETLLMHRGLYEAGMKTFSQMDMNNYCNRFMKEKHVRIVSTTKSGFALSWEIM